MSNAAPCGADLPVRLIAVIRPNHRLGNTLLLTPLFSELERRFPGAQVEVITAGGAARAVLRGFPQVTAIHAFPGMSFRHPLRVLSLLAMLRRRGYDLAIDPMPHQRAGRFLLGLVGAHRKLGFRWGKPRRDRMLSRSADPAGAPIRFSQAPVYLLRAAWPAGQAATGMGAASGAHADTDGRGTGPAEPGADETRAADTGMVALELRLTAAERHAGEDRLAAALGGACPPGTPRIGIFAHATGRKRLALEWWRQLAVSLRVQLPGAQLLEIVPDDGRPRLAGVMPGLHTPDLRLLGATLAALSLVVIADGGVMHLADAAGARVLGLFLSTDPARYGPGGRGCEALDARGLDAGAAAAHIAGMLGQSHAAAATD
ncbi:MAG TPA: glycosyltransferase family 9 protein [Steroidobacteraceae bacterium]|nr:glycosyltransferase family 9 protein [Steroidobacteraceae bacterium]